MNSDPIASIIVCRFPQDTLKPPPAPPFAATMAPCYVHGTMARARIRRTFQRTSPKYSAMPDDSRQPGITIPRARTRASALGKASLRTSRRDVDSIAAYLRPTCPARLDYLSIERSRSATMTAGSDDRSIKARRAMIRRVLIKQIAAPQPRTR